ncbi:MAG: 2,3-bisphosphoglycerate-independent phosphoglycerate mutase [Desulfobacterales bacterium]|nr:MAG: 2,3-bisphosphoglycerate-independent phosphoglycerate mutase [Desulfobacterales bacterium]
MDAKRPCMLMILDGWGINSRREANAVALARTPFLDQLWTEYPRTQLLCSGQAVGLPDGIMGNSEVGHLNIGAGRTVYQDLLRIDRAVQDRSFFANEELKAVMAAVKANRAVLHLMGLVSDGGVHSHLNHLLALLDMARFQGVERVCVHAFLDGRDTPPHSGAGFLAQAQKHMRSLPCGSLATVCGRFYAMDRDSRWDRVEQAFRLLTRGEGLPEKDPVAGVKKAYARNETDEFVKPMVITDDHQMPLGRIRDGDGIVCFNFRADRARQITRVLTEPAFDAFKRAPWPTLCGFVCMTQYDEKFTLPVAFPPLHLDEILGEVISRRGLKQLRIAETEKYAHVTYFFNGGEEKPFPFEDRCLIPSPREVATYDLKPEMSALEVTAEVMARLRSNTYDLIVLNFANMDMVGHTGVLAAAVKACETVDACVGKIITALKKIGGVALVTSDHGNAETMADEKGQAHTAHSLNPVPLILVDDLRQGRRLRPGILGDIAPTILEIMGIAKPDSMTGKSLLAT